MDQLIAVVDLTSGKRFERDRETLTLDIPLDFDHETGGVFVDADKLGRYRTKGGETRVYSTVPKRLSDRAAGEECLVPTKEVDSSGVVCTRHYWRSVVKPLR
jgi:hypothetical protein